MGWDAAVFGSVKLAAKARTAWLAGKVDSRAVPGASEYLAKARFGPRPVGETIAALSAAAVTHLELVTTRTPIRIAAVLTKDDYLDWAPAIAALFGAALACGGTGEVVFCGLEGAQFGYVQTAAGVTALAGKAVTALDRRPEFKQLRAIYFGEADTGRDDKVWALNPFTKKPMRIARTGTSNLDATRAALVRAGFDPDTGKPTT